MKKIMLGYQRKETAGFIDFRRHWDFAAEFRTPVEAHEKGSIEREAGYFRETVMVRRMKWELKLQEDGSRRFAERVVCHLEVPYTATERQAHEALKRYTELRLRSAQTDTERFAAGLV